MNARHALHSSQEPSVYTQSQIDLGEASFRRLPPAPVLRPATVPRTAPAVAEPALPTGRERSVLDAGDRYPGVDHFKLHAYQMRGRRLQADESLRALAAVAHRAGRLVRIVAAWVIGLRRQPKSSQILETPRDYAARRAPYLGRSL